MTYRRIIDNFLPEIYIHELQTIINDPAFKWSFASIYPMASEYYNPDDWYLMRRVVSEENSNGENDRDLWNSIKPVLYFVEDKFQFRIDSILRCQINNFINRNHQPKANWHNDQEDIPYFLGMLYLEDSPESPTRFFDGNHIDHVRNRFALVEAGDQWPHTQHSANYAKKTLTRTHINFNFLGHFI